MLLFKCHSSEEEIEKLVVQMFEGHYFGELALIYGEPRNASVRATGEVGMMRHAHLFRWGLHMCVVNDKTQTMHERLVKGHSRL